MGIGSKIKAAYGHANEWFGRHGIIFSVFLWIVVPAAVAGGMIWLALQLWWFWRWFGWFGVATVILVTWMLLGVGLAAYRFWSRQSSPTSPQQRSEAPINWNPWKRRSKYNVSELSKLLAHSDPVSTTTTSDAAAFCRLIMEDIEAKKLAHIAVYEIDHRGERHQKAHSFDTEILKDVAIKWARGHDFTVSHFE